MRLVLLGVNNTNYCAAITGTSGTVAYGDFNTTCWTTGGTAYNEEAINGIVVMVPGNGATAVNYSFCLNVLSDVQ